MAFELRARRWLFDILSKPCRNCGAAYGPKVLMHTGYQDFYPLCLECLLWMAKP